jgi:hypothetical protein
MPTTYSSMTCVGSFELCGAGDPAAIAATRLDASLCEHAARIRRVARTAYLFIVLERANEYAEM